MRGVLLFEDKHIQIFKDQITAYKDGISEEDLTFTKNALIKSNARRFETQFNLLGMLQEMSEYNLPANYIEKEEQVINDMTLEMHKTLANTHLDESKMAYLVVGDAASQFAQFKDMGFDEVKLLDKIVNRDRVSFIQNRSIVYKRFLQVGT